MAATPTRLPRWSTGDTAVLSISPVDLHTQRDQRERARKRERERASGSAQAQHRPVRHRGPAQGWLLVGQAGSTDADAARAECEGREGAGPVSKGLAPVDGVGLGVLGEEGEEGLHLRQRVRAVADLAPRPSVAARDLARQRVPCVGAHAVRED
eukprot:268290-Rhodomonas_salina.1